MALMMRWAAHLACQVLGYPSDDAEHGSCSNRNGALKGSYSCSINKVNNNNNSLHPAASGFQMPLHYPRYTKADYEKMEEWKVDLLLQQYGLTNVKGNLDEKRAFAMGAFLWPDQY